MAAEWTTPLEWMPNDLVTAALLNTHLRDNLEYLLSPNHERIVFDNSGDITLTNVLTFQDIDATNLSISLTTHGGPVLVHLQCVARSNGTSHDGYLDIAVDDVRAGADHTLGLANINSLENLPVSISALLTDLEAGTYVLRPQWRTAASDTFRILCDSADHPIIFEAIEL